MHSSLLRVCGILLLLTSFISPILPFQTPEQTTIWKGFEQVKFERKGVPAYYVKPKRALPGNPWVWRAYFSDWHTEVDSLLLARGFYVAFVQAKDLFGHPRAMAIWDDFYHYLVTDRVDHQPEQTLDLFTVWSNSLHLPVYLLLKNALTAGKHTLRLRVATGKNEDSQGSACRVVHLLVNQ